MLTHFLTAHLGLLYELAGAFVFLGALIFVSGALIARFDDLPLEDAVYLAFVTAFTVGFGDVSPKSRGARVVTVGLAFLGLILMGIAVAVAVHALDVAIEVQHSDG